MKNRLIYSVCVLVLVFACAYVGYRSIRAYTIEHNKAYAYSWIKKIREVQIAYHQKYGRYGSLADLSKAGLLTNEWTQISASPYKFDVVITDKGYEASVTPMSKGTGNVPYISYYLNETGVIKRDAK